MKRLFYIFLAIVCLCPCLAWAASAKEGASEERSSYLAERGNIVPPDEIYIDSYIASVDYRYPIPSSSVFGVSMYSGHRQLSMEGQEEVIQIGIQAGKSDFEDLTPMNLAFVIDHSGSMADADKLSWVRHNRKLLEGSATALLDFYSWNLDQAQDCVLEIGEQLTQKGKSWNLETIAKNAANQPTTSAN